eukprot:303420-Pleurochrysis_carterae.AAC.1
MGRIVHIVISVVYGTSSSVVCMHRAHLIVRVVASCSLAAFAAAAAGWTGQRRGAAPSSRLSQDDI